MDESDGFGFGVAAAFLLVFVAVMAAWSANIWTAAAVANDCGKLGKTIVGNAVYECRKVEAK